MTTLRRAHAIRNTLGTRRAAGYMRNKGYPLSMALYWLCQR